jgi:ribose 1,5-bisphosphokinase
MRAAADRPGDAAAPIGPGRLVLVVGPSGAGKDTLIHLAREACANNPTIVFPRRVVTREASAAEDNGAIDAEQFARARERGDFAIHWEAHGLRYGLPRALVDDIREGKIVVANVSRGVIASVRATFAEVVVVLVTAPPEVLALRLTARARASDGPHEARLRRAVAFPAPDVVIENLGAPETHARELLRAIEGRASGQT